MDEFQIVDTDANTTYIYALLDPDTREARYVGKSDVPVQRLKAHLTHAIGGYSYSKDGRVPPKSNWIASLHKADKVPLLAILQAVPNTPAEWGRAEQRWIERLAKEGHALLNAQVVNARPSEEEVFQDALDLGRELFDTDL